MLITRDKRRFMQYAIAILSSVIDILKYAN